VEGHQGFKYDEVFKEETNLGKYSTQVGRRGLKSGGRIFPC